MSVYVFSGLLCHQFPAISCLVCVEAAADHTDWILLTTPLEELRQLRQCIAREIDGQLTSEAASRYVPSGQHELSKTAHSQSMETLVAFQARQLMKLWGRPQGESQQELQSKVKYSTLSTSPLSQSFWSHNRTTLVSCKQTSSSLKSPSKPASKSKSKEKNHSHIHLHPTHSARTSRSKARHPATLTVNHSPTISPKPTQLPAASTPSLESPHVGMTNILPIPTPPSPPSSTSSSFLTPPFASSSSSSPSSASAIFLFLAGVFFAGVFLAAAFLPVAGVASASLPSASGVPSVVAAAPDLPPEKLAAWVRNLAMRWVTAFGVQSWRS